MHIFRKVQNMIDIKTERLFLRNVQQSDAAVMHDYRNKPICAKFQRGQRTALQDIQALVNARQRDTISDQENFLIAVSLKETDEMIGEIVVMPNDGCFSIGYTFHYNFHRKGYAFEALTRLISLLHQTYPEMEFISFTEPENIPSRKLLEKLGYSDMGYVPQVTSQMYGKWIKDTPADQ